jgi:hypothetical protein
MRYFHVRLIRQTRLNHNDLTQPAHAPSAARGSALDGYQTTFNNQQHVNYIGTDNHIHELSSSAHGAITT